MRRMYHRVAFHRCTFPRYIPNTFEVLFDCTATDNPLDADDRNPTAFPFFDLPKNRPRADVLAFQRGERLGDGAATMKVPEGEFDWQGELSESSTEAGMDTAE